jgi:uncharacterized caspase-like protein
LQLKKNAAPPPDQTGTQPPPKTTSALERARKQYGRRIAVTIGINAYRGGAITPLGAAVGDARRMAELFTKMGYDEVIRLEDQKATRAGMLDVLERQVPLRAEERDLVTIFFAGHGITKGDMGYVLPQDADTNVERTAISVEELKNAAMRMKARHVLYLVDACFSGSMFKKPAPSGPTSTQAYWEALAAGRVIQIMTAGGADQKVIEKDGWGAFTRHAHGGLEGAADPDGDGVVTMDELFAHVKQRVVSDTGGRQTPQYGNVEGLDVLALFDARRAGEAPRVERPLLAGLESELKRVHDRMSRRDWVGAEKLVRELALKKDDPELNLLLAEIYAEQDPLGNASIVDRELKRVEERRPSPGQERRMLDVRARVEAARRGPLGR